MLLRWLFVFLAGIICAAVFTSRARIERVSAFNPSENALFMTDYNPNSGVNTPCTGPGRLIRVLTGTQWQAGPTVSGLTLDLPTHFTFDAGGRIYIADRENRRVLRMDDLAGTNAKSFTGAGANLLSNPGTRFSCTETTDGVYATAIDSAGRIYISTFNPGGLVRVDDMDGTNWTKLDFSTGNLYPARDIALDAQGRIYLSDNQLHRIVRFDNMQGAGFVAYGSMGNGPGQFYEPEGVAIDAQGRIYIGDENNHRVVRINDMTGAGWTSYGSYGSAAGQLSHPHGLAFDTLGRLYIADTNNLRIVRINSIEGGGWVAIGNREIMGRDIRFNATKGVGTLGRGADLPYISIFPQIAIGGEYRTTVVSLNPSASSINADFSFARSIQPPCASVGATLPTCATPLTVTVNGENASSFSRTVPAKGVVRLEATSSAGLTAGYARIRANDELQTLVLFRTMSGDTIRAEAGVGLAPMADHFTVYIDNTNNAQSGYAIVNPVTEGIQPEASPGVFGGWINLTAKLRDKSGALLDTKVLNVAPGKHISEFASQEFPGKIGSDFEGSVEFDCGYSCTRASAVALRYDNAAADVFTTIPVTFHVEDPSREPSAHPYLKPSRTTTLSFPQVADGSSYRTNFILVNTNDTATTATLSFYSDTGTPLSIPIAGTPRSTYSVTLPARGVAHVVTDGTSAGIAAGWARLTAPIEGVGGSAIFQTVVQGTIAAEAGVSSSPAATRFVTYADTLGFADSGIALSNPGSSNVNVTLNLRNASGQIVASTVQNIVALGHFARMFSQLFPTGFDEFEGTLEVAATGAVSGVALRYDNPGGTTFSTTPIVPIF